VVVHRRQAPSISPPVSEPPEESTRIVGDARIAGIRVASDRGVLLTYGDHSLVKSHRQDVEPTAAISRSGSLSNGTSGVSKVCMCPPHAPSTQFLKKNSFHTKDRRLCGRFERI